MLLALLLVSSVTLAQESVDQDEAAQQAALAKASQNPVANLISIPFEFWHHEGESGNGFAGIVKPVIPTPVGGMNLINRFIIPYASVSGTMDPPGSDPLPIGVDAKVWRISLIRDFCLPPNPGLLSGERELP